MKLFGKILLGVVGAGVLYSALSKKERFLGDKLVANDEASVNLQGLTPNSPELRALLQTAPPGARLIVRVTSVAGGDTFEGAVVGFSVPDGKGGEVAGAVPAAFEGIVIRSLPRSAVSGIRRGEVSIG